MSERDREYMKLKEEVSETRKQSSKTESQFCHLLDTFKAFEARFEHLERRGRISHVGSHLIAAVVVAVTVYIIASVETRMVREELQETQRAAAAGQKEAVARAEQLASQLQEYQAKQSEREAARRIATTFVEHLDGGRHNDAADLLDKLDLVNLDPLAQKLITSRVETFRAEMATETYEWGRELLNRRRRRDAIEELRKSVTIWPTSPFADTARYLLANSLREAKRYDEAIPVFEQIRKYETDKSILDEVHYWEGYCRARLGEIDAAARIFEDIVKAGGRHASSAKAQLSTLAAN